MLGKSRTPFILEGSQPLKVVGESFYQDALLKIVGGRTHDGASYPVVAVLEAEPSNPYDSNAVAVTVSGRKVGYLPKGLAIAFQPHVQRLMKEHQGPVAVRGTIMGGWDRGDGDLGSFGITLRHDPADFR